MGGSTTFININKVERLNLWAYIFDMIPLATVLAVFKILTPGVAFESFYSGRSAIHKKWMQSQTRLGSAPASSEYGG